MYHTAGLKSMYKIDLKFRLVRNNYINYLQDKISCFRHSIEVTTLYLS